MVSQFTPGGYSFIIYKKEERERQYPRARSTVVISTPTRLKCLSQTFVDGVQMRVPLSPGSCSPARRGRGTGAGCDTLLNAAEGHPSPDDHTGAEREQ